MATTEVLTVRLTYEDDEVDVILQDKRIIVIKQDRIVIWPSGGGLPSHTWDIPAPGEGMKTRE